MDAQEFLYNFLNKYEMESNRFSCLRIALIDARKLTGRDLHSGEHRLNIYEGDRTFFNPFSFIGVINYLLILEMIGEIFRIPSFSAEKSSTIYKALKQFSSISDSDIHVLIALRNSLAHNYGLINIPRSESEFDTKRHKFTLVYSDVSNLIEYPLEKWSGDFSDKSDNTSTKISYVKLTDLVESVALKLNAQFNNGILSIALKGGIDELKARFTITKS